MEFCNHEGIVIDAINRYFDDTNNDDEKIFHKISIYDVNILLCLYIDYFKNNKNLKSIIFPLIFSELVICFGFLMLGSFEKSILFFLLTIVTYLFYRFYDKNFVRSDFKKKTFELIKKYRVCNEYEEHDNSITNAQFDSMFYSIKNSELRSIVKV